MRTLPLLLLACCVSNNQTLTVGATQLVVSAAPFSLQVKRDGKLLTQATRLLVTADQPHFVAQLLPGWDDYQANESAPIEATHGRMVRASATSARAVFRLDGDAEPLTLDMRVEEGRVLIELQNTDTRFAKTSLELRAGSDEHFFGLGERFASVDHRGLSLYSWAEEGGLGTGENMPPARGAAPLPNGSSMTYFPVPFVHSTAGYSLFANTTWRTEMKMASEAPDVFTVVAHAQKLPVVIYTEETPLQRLARYTAETGRPMVPAPWVWGMRMRAAATDVANGELVYKRMRARHLPVTAFDDTTHFLPNNSHVGREQALKEGTDTLHRWGYKVVAYNTPYVAKNEPRSQENYDYGVAHGLFQKKLDGEPATTVFISGKLLTLSPIDLSNPDGTAWYQQLLSRTLDLGYDGWMNDFGEYTARTSVMADGRTGAEIHNLFPVLSAAAAHALLEERKPNDYWFFVRSGYVGTQAFVPQVWGGDSEASFDDSQGLPSAVRGGLNLGMVGVSQYGSDTTGFKCVTNDPHDKEVYIRWLQFGAVSPLFHEENACANPVQSQSKWKLWNDEETQEAWRSNASFHTRLAPYLRAAAVEANATGTPIMRHPFLTHPNEADGWAVEDSYFFGPSLYAAPVVRRGQTSRHVWLPPGRYVEWTERTVHIGPGFVDVPAPLMRLPLFLVENSLVPMLDADVETLAPAEEPSVITEQSRASLMDVIAVLSPGGQARMQLVDGTLIELIRDQTEGQSTTKFVIDGSAGHQIAGILGRVSGSPNRVYRFEVIRL